METSESKVFLNLVVQKIDPSNIQEFMRSWLKQVCKDFRIVFIDKDLSKDQLQAVDYALNFAKALDLSDIVTVVNDENAIPQARSMKILKDTSELPCDKLEILKFRSNFKEPNKKINCGENDSVHFKKSLSSSKLLRQKQRLSNIPSNSETKTSKKSAKSIIKPPVGQLPMVILNHGSLEKNVKQLIKVEVKNLELSKEEKSTSKIAAKQRKEDLMMKETIQKKPVLKQKKDDEPKTKTEKVFFKIIIPNYNNMAYIKKCLDSILEQTFQDFKIIIVDDISTDSSNNFCQAYARLYPKKIVFLQQQSKEYAGGARNVGLEYPIDCKYILFIDSDDWLYNNTVLSRIHDQIIKSKKNVKLIKMGMFTFFGENDRRNYIRKFSSNLTLEEAFFKGCGPGRTCISADLACCKFKANRRIANDVIWFLRCMDRLTNKNLLSIQFPWAVYNRISTTSGTNLIKSNKTSEQYISQMQLLLMDLKAEKFKTATVKKIQKDLIAEYSQKFGSAKFEVKPAIDIKLPSQNPFTGNIDYEYKKEGNGENKIHILLVNFGNTMKFTRSVVNDLIVQTADFDLTIVDNDPSFLNNNVKYFSLLAKQWKFDKRSLHIIGLKNGIALNKIWNTFYDTTTNPWLCFLNNDVCIPENFISDNLKIVEEVKSAGIINHTTNNPQYKTSAELTYKIYDMSSNSFMHRQGWDFTIERSLYVKIPPEFTTFVGDCIQFNSVYKNNKDVVFVYSSPILHYGSTSRKQNFDYFKQVLKLEREIFQSSNKYLPYGNDKVYDFDKNFSVAKPQNIDLLKQNIYGIEKKIIVSMTTWKDRIQNIPKVLNSILQQTVKPNQIVVNLSKDEFKSIDELPKEVYEFVCKNNIEINLVDGNTKVYKKIIPTMLIHKNDLVLSIDDDFIYPNTMIADFYKAYKQTPNQPISGNRISKFNLNCHCGCASLVQYKFYNIYIENYLKYYQHCPSSDIFFTITAYKNGYTYARTSNIYFNNMESIPNTNGYSKQCKRRSIDMINDTYKWLEKNI